MHKRVIIATSRTPSARTDLTQLKKPPNALVLSKPRVRIDSDNATTINASMSTMYRLWDAEILRAVMDLSTCPPKLKAVSEKRIGNRPGKSLKRPPSTMPFPIPFHNVFRLSTESQWIGQAEFAFTSSMLRLNP